jgi:tetratricopeptide (TPR) repeat protein
MNMKALTCMLLMSAAIWAGCATAPEVAKETPVEDKTKIVADFLDRARQQESNGDLVEALESYRLALTVDPNNPTALSKQAELEGRLDAMAAENYREGAELYRIGKYAQARQKLLTALRYKPDFPEAVAILKAERLDAQRVKAHFPYVIKPGELLSNVAERYYRDYHKHYLIGAYNEVDDATKITAGKSIKVPVVEGIACFVSPVEAEALSKQHPAPLPPEVIVVTAVATHTTRPGDSLSQLSQQYYGVKNQADLIARYNNLKEATGFKPGRKLLIPQVKGIAFHGAGSVEAPKAEAPPAPPPAPEQPAAEQKAQPPAPPKETPPAPAAAPPDQTAGYRQQGIEFYKAKNYPAAIAEFKKVLNVQPKDPASLQYISQAYFDLGVGSYEKKDYLKAIESFKASLEYNPSCAKCEQYIRNSQESYKHQHYNQGLVHFQNEKLEEAIQEWERVQAMDPGYKDVGKNLQKARTLLERLESIKRSKPQ